MKLGSSQVEAEVDVSPFDLKPVAGEANGAAALCLHGLTGTPYEVRPVAEALTASGVRAVGIWMAGHNGTVEDLARTSRHEWVEHAAEALAALQAEHEKVFLVGVSLGGLVCLRLAEQHRVDGLVTIGSPLSLPFPIPQLIPVLRLFATARPKRSSGVRDPYALARHPRFPAMPYDAVRELIRLQREVVQELDAIRAPILVAHGVHDETALPSNAARIFEGVGTAASDKRLMMFERSGHVVTVDYDGPELARRAVRFLLGERDVDSGAAPS
jgi:carboxylesterase